VYVLTSVGRVQQLFPVLAPLRPTLIAGVLCVILFVMGKDRRRSLAQLRHPITTCALVLLALVALSVPFSIYPRLSLTFLYDDFAKTIVLFVVVAGSVRSLMDVRRLSFVFLLSATIYSAVMIVQTGGVGEERLAEAYTYDANDIALLIVTTLPFAFFGIVSARRLPARLFAVFALLVNAVVFVKTGSRGGFLAGCVLLVFFALLNRATSRGARLLIVGTVVGLMAIVGPAWYWSQMRTISDPGQDYNTTSLTGRKAVWTRGIRYMLSRPVTGVGASCFPTAEGKLSGFGQQFAAEGRGWKWSTAHNSFIQAGAELGVPGLITFSLLLYQVFRTFFRVSRRTLPRRGRGGREVAGLAFAGASAVVGFVAAGFFLSQAYSSILFTLAGLALGLEKVTRAAPLGRSRRPTVPQPA
jgi:O-antigen ligase